MSKTSNIDQIVAWLQGFVDSFQFDRPGRDQSLGRDVGHTVVRGPNVDRLGGILGRCADGVGPDGTGWEPNAPKYAARKQRKYGHSEVNRRTGQMLAEASFQIVVQPDLVQIVYGWNTPPGGSAAPEGYLSDADRAVTDRQKARYAHEGQSAQRIKRPFMGWNDEDRVNVIEVCQANLDGYIRWTNQQNQA